MIGWGKNRRSICGRNTCDPSGTARAWWLPRRRGVLQSNRHPPKARVGLYSDVPGSDVRLAMIPDNRYGQRPSDNRDDAATRSLSHNGCRWLQRTALFRQKAPARGVRGRVQHNRADCGVTGSGRGRFRFGPARSRPMPLPGCLPSGRQATPYRAPPQVMAARAVCLVPNAHPHGLGGSRGRFPPCPRGCHRTGRMRALRSGHARVGPWKRPWFQGLAIRPGVSRSPPRRPAPALARWPWRPRERFQSRAGWFPPRRGSLEPSA